MQVYAQAIFAALGAGSKNLIWKTGADDFRLPDRNEKALTASNPWVSGGERGEAADREEASLGETNLGFEI